ncbi:MAG: phytanoyl-CoA dioxygenase [Flavobacteriaceae bacterium]
METKENHSFVKGLSTRLLGVKVNGDETKKIVSDINDHFLKIIGITERIEDIDHLAGTPTKTGIALSFNHAADCLLDYIRTEKFLKGFVSAIKNKQEEHPNETIQIFYAGCGPLAPFVTLVAPLFTPEEVQFSLLEINNKSLRAAKKLIKGLGLTEYIQNYYLADAITFDIPNPEKIHILFSETLDALLHRECYVPILWNLLPQIPKETLVIPENVQIKVNYKKEGQKEGEETFGKVVFDTRKALAEVEKTDTLPEKLLPTFLSLEDAEQYFSIVVDTEVQIYEDIILTRSESSLTLAIEIPIQKPITHKGVDFVYHLTPTPSLKLVMVE